MSATRRRIAVTGLGAVTPLGVGVRLLWDGLLAGRSGLAPITRFDHSRFDVHIAGEVKDWVPEQHMDPREARRQDRYAQFSVAAAGEAMKDSGLDMSREDATRAGVVMGSGIGGIEEFEQQKERLMGKGPGRVSPFLIPKLMANAGSGIVSIVHGLRGPNFTVVTACASAAHSLGCALRLIQYGEADIMVSGGAEAAVTPLAVAGFGNMGALTKRTGDPTEASRPFDKDRDGFVIGEGAGALVLEEWEHARKRGARIYCEFAGFGMSGDAYHITAPCEDGDGGARAMLGALRDAGFNPEDVNYINAHGTSTPLNDKAETLGIKKTFGDYAYRIPINSTKSMTGHTLGAAGGIEAVVVALTIAQGRIHRTLNWRTRDPDCDLDYVPEGVREQAVTAAISNSLGFGGHNATLAFRACR